jgi:CDP-glucose 4,6-dehydratase
MIFEMNFDKVYENCRVFLTGHTGFKGAWLSAWLEMLGASVCGYSLDPPTEPAHFPLLNSKIDNQHGDVRNGEALKKSMQEFAPEIVFHLAAQPIVRTSYDDPVLTIETNVIGTANLLEACRKTPSVRAVIVITTDKCYENKEWIWGYRENDRLGGYDPYSASKACAEIIAASYRSSFSNGSLLIATCRSGNAIGGGDWAKDRLIPDLVRATVKGKPTVIRMPNATRPWQHVLEPLNGYLRLGQRLLEGKKEFAEAWNFGPNLDGNISVGELVQKAKTYWNEIEYEIIPNEEKHETSLLMLDCGKARQRLNWQPVWTLEQGIERTITWYRDFYERKQIKTREQIEEFSAT